MVSYSDLKDQTSHFDGSANLPVGVVWALSGAFFYSVYIVLLRRKVQVINKNIFFVRELILILKI